MPKMKKQGESNRSAEQFGDALQGSECEFVREGVTTPGFQLAVLSRGTNP
jgi:hypothetical protein